MQFKIKDYSTLTPHLFFLSFFLSSFLLFFFFSFSVAAAAFAAAGAACLNFAVCVRSSNPALFLSCQQPASQSYAQAPVQAQPPQQHAPPPQQQAPPPQQQQHAPPPQPAAAAAPAPAAAAAPAHTELDSRVARLTLEQETQGTLHPYPNFNAEEDVR